MATGDVLFTGGRPLIMEDAYVEIGGVNLSCLCMEVGITAENRTVEVATMCGIQEFPSVTKWHFVAKLAQSFEAAGTNDALSAALLAWDTSETACDYKVRPHAGTAVSAGNPEITGKMIPQDYNIITGAAGTVSEVDIDWICQDTPTLSSGDIPLAQAKEAPKVPAAAPA